MDTATEKLYFASDYMEGAHPAVLEALVRTNEISTVGYGEDEFCRKAAREILAACDCPNGEVRFLVGGTQTNAVIIDALLKSYQGVIAAASGHIATHEAGAIEYGGHKVLTAESHAGKLTAEGVRKVAAAYAADENREHTVMPGMVYISQPTEYGTIYSRAELATISEVCRQYNLFLFLDGARLAYALAAAENDAALPDLARYCDVFSIGGTKCGLLFGEAVVLTRKDIIPHFTGIIKQHGALLAKGRLLGVQFDALFADGLYERIGQPAIAAARQIAAALKKCGYAPAFPTPTNQIFFIADDDFIAKLKEKVVFSFMEKIDANRTMIRFATAWSTTPHKTAKLAALLESLSE